MNEQEWLHIEKLIQEIAEGQRAKILSVGRRIIPYLTPDDLLQPNDFPELEHHPHFRYEEGIIEGIMTVQMALAALKNNNYCL